MDLERGSTRIYHCTVCNVDTPHSIRGRKRDLYGLMCTNCQCGALVTEGKLLRYQLQWEEELRSILDDLTDREDS